MSLINDALRRVSKTPPPADSPLAPPLQPAPASHKPKAPLVPILLGVLGCILVFAGWLLWRGSANSNQPKAREAQVAPAKTLAQVKKAVTPEISTPAPVQTQKVETEVVSVPAEPSTPTPAPEPPGSELTTTNAQTEVPPSVPVPEIPTPFPDLQVKAIAYHPTSGKAFINDRTVGLGEEIDGVRVIKIEPNKVTVEWNGQTKELFLQ